MLSFRSVEIEKLEKPTAIATGLRQIVSRLSVAEVQAGANKIVQELDPEGGLIPLTMAQDFLRFHLPMDSENLTIGNCRQPNEQPGLYIKIRGFNERVTANLETLRYDLG